jgi:adenylate kinase family enzyme
LGEVLNLPVYHIDGIHHLENWKKRDKDERDKIILEKVSKEKWIIDGTYRSTLKERLENADLVIFLDYSSISQLKGVLGRFIKNHGKEKPEIPGCKEEISFRFFFWVLNWRKNKRGEIIEDLNKIDKDKILIFKSRRKLNKWFYNEFNRKIIS